jgi:glycosyltransferase involved in cell wall biosynthesis
MTTICLAVIARNEAHVIARALASARPLIDAWVVVDTGSTDATREVARETMRGVPGEVLDRPWRGFGASRTESLELARGRADYALVLDADDVFEYPPGARFPALTLAGYQLLIHDGPLQYPRMLLLKSSEPWRFEGAVHEYPVCDGAVETGFVQGIICRRTGSGGVDRDKATSLRDAAILEEELRRDPNNARSVFYLARSYEDAGDLARALAEYERRVLMGGWDEELFYAAYRAARVRERLEEPREAVNRAFLEAWHLRPQRAEPLYDLARLARGAGNWIRARAYAAAAAAMPMPPPELSVHHEVYSWRALDELAGASAQLGEFRVAAEANRALLKRPQLPPEERARVEANLALCLNAVK